MPYKRYARKRVMRRKRMGGRSSAPWYAKKYSVGSLASAAMRGVWKLKGLVNSERFKFDTTFSAQPVTSSGTVYHVTNIAQGDGYNARTGNSIFVRAVNLKGTINEDVKGDPFQEVKLALIMDTQQVSDGTPSVTDIYATNSVNSHLNPATVGRYKVLWSKNYLLDPGRSYTAKVDHNISLRHHIRYNGTGSTDIQKGGLYLVTISSQATANYPIFNGELRVSYHDN